MERCVLLIIIVNTEVGMDILLLRTIHYSCEGIVQEGCGFSFNFDEQAPALSVPWNGPQRQSQCNSLPRREGGLVWLSQLVVLPVGWAGTRIKNTTTNERRGDQHRGARDDMLGLFGHAPNEPRDVVHRPNPLSQRRFKLWSVTGPLDRCFLVPSGVCATGATRRHGGWPVS